MTHLRPAGGEHFVERIYPRGRHENFNEINKHEVLADVAAFINETVTEHA
jgi:alpha-beta hydrolase superfamily lysophospholipase